MKQLDESSAANGNPMKNLLHIDARRAGIWTATIANPTINLLDRETSAELLRLVSELERDPSVKVVVLQSVAPDFFFAHAGTTSAGRQAGDGGADDYVAWLDFVLRLGKAPVVSIAKIRGRARGLGNELALACDLRFASRERAVFAQPEVGAGIIPGGGAMEWLPRMLGRSRAMEIILGAGDFDADTAERYGMINRAVDDADLDRTVDGLAERIASFDKRALGEAKRLLNRVGVPAALDHVVSSRLCAQSMAWDDASRRVENRF